MGECFFWYRPTRVVPDKRPLNGCVCVCVCVCVQYKTEKDGVIETRIEKRLVISGTTASDVDHDKVYSAPHWHLPVSQHLPVLEHLPVSALASTLKTREINLFNAVPKTF